MNDFKKKKKTKHKLHIQTLASEETGKKKKQVKSPTALSFLQQGSPLKYKTNWLILEKSPRRRGNKLSGCIHQSNLPYRMEPVSHALGQPEPLWGVLRARFSRQVVPAAARALPENSPKGTS